MPQSSKCVIILFYMLHVSRCHQAANDTSYEDEPENDGTLEALVKMGRYWQQRLNLTEEFLKDSPNTKNLTKDSPFEDLFEDSPSRRSQGRYYLRVRPKTKPYPTFVHCRGILPFCKKVCVEVNQRICREWQYLCPPRVYQDMPRRCILQCTNNYRTMRLKFPNQLKLYRDSFEPRYDRFDYSERGNGFPEHILKPNRPPGFADDKK